MSQDTNTSQPSPPATAAAPAPSAEGMVVHTRAKQLLEWLLPALVRFPREHRHTVTQHMAGLAMRTHDALVQARHQRGSARAAALRAADSALDQLRQYGQLAWAWHWWNDGQYQHFSRLCEALGRPLGGWRRQVGDPPRGRQEG